MLDIFKKEHSVATSYDDSKYLEEFFDAYQIKHEALLHKGQIEFRAKMFAHEFNAFCDYLGELGLMGIYPIRL